MNPVKHQVIVLVGSGAIGQAIARRVGMGKQILLADLREENAQAAASTMQEAGYQTHTAAVDISDRSSIDALVQKAQGLGDIVALINSAGVSPSQATPSVIFAVDLVGTAMLLDAFGDVIAGGGNGIVISSQSGFRLGNLDEADQRVLATLRPEQLVELPLVKNETDSLRAYQISKRGNALRVSAEAVRWGKRGARLNCISPGIVFTPLANDELNGERKDFYRNMLANLPVGRGGNPDEIGALAEFIMSGNGGYITGSDFLIDGGATANFFFGEKG